MFTAMPAGRVFAFGNLELDERAGVLTSRTARIDVAPKVFELLSYLVRNPQRLLSRRELLDALWPDTHVTDASLARAVTGARAALRAAGGDDAILETVPRRGYRLAAAVTERQAAKASLSRFALLTPNGAVPLREGATVLGRGGDADVQLDDATVSRTHARLTIAGQEAWIEDAGSKNGTRVNGEPIRERVAIAAGDALSIGSVPVVFVASSDETTTTMHAPSAAGRGR